MTEMMFTMTVLIKSVGSTCRVKYPTKKDGMRVANWKIQASRQSLVSGLEPLWHTRHLWGNLGCLEPPSGFAHANR
jgi:hypothetical protein